MVVAALVLSAAPAWERGGGGVEAYRYGDYVQTAWRGQLGEMRTQWQDVVARHCPRFRQNSVAVLTIPRPRDEPEVRSERGVLTPCVHQRTPSEALNLPRPSPPPAPQEGLGEYKVSYGVDSERHVTFWLPLIEKTPKLLLPAVRLEMLHAGGAPFPHARAARGEERLAPASTRRARRRGGREDSLPPGQVERRTTRANRRSSAVHGIRSSGPIMAFRNSSDCRRALMRACVPRHTRR